MEDVLDKSKQELLDEIYQLRMECDIYHARADAYKHQLESLGEIPVEHTFLEPLWEPEPPSETDSR